MASYILKRIIHLIPVLFFVSIITFSLVHIAPGDPAVIMAGGHQTSQKVLDSIRKNYHLNDNVVSQYVRWLGNVLKGDLGQSFKMKQSVSTMIVERLPVTVQLILMSMGFTLLFSVPLGILAAVKKTTFIDYVVSIFALLGVSSPVFLTGIIAILIFSYQLNILPAFGTGKDVVDNFRYMLLPSSALALNMIALSMKITRGSMIEVLNTNYIQTAIAKGMPRKLVLFKHGLRNALIPLITVTGLQIGFLMTGTVMVEYTFGIGGLGSLVINSVQSSDYPVIQGTTLFMVVVFLFINLLVDILYAFIDPRIRYS